MPAGRDLLIVHGPPRSGTTPFYGLVCSTLGASMMPECTYLTQLIELYSNTVRYPDKTRFSYFFGDRARAADVYRPMAVRMLEALTANSRAGAPIVIKDPGLSVVLPEVRELLGDDVRLLGIVRHPADTLASMKRVRQRANQIWDLAVEAAYAYRHYEGARTSDSPVLRYEDLIANDPVAISRLEDALGTRLKPEPQADAAWLRPDDPFYAAGYGKRFDAAFAGEGAATLTAIEVEYVQHVFAGILDHWGYEPKPPTADDAPIGSAPGPHSR